MENEKTLTAREGMILTNGKNIGKIVDLGEQDRPENWHEITEAEAEQQLSIV